MAKIRRTSCFVFLALSFVALCAGAAFANEQAKAGDFDFIKTNEFVREMETSPSFPGGVVLAYDYVYSLLTLGEKIDPVRKIAIVSEIKHDQQQDGGFIADQANEGASILYTDAALETLDLLNATDAIQAGRVKSFVVLLKNADGGFGFSQAAKESTLATTFHSVRVLKAVNGLELVDKARTAAYVKGFERKDGGFGFVKGTGVANAKSTYMAAYVLNALGALDEATRARAVAFLATTPYAVGEKSAELPDLDEQLNAVLALKELKATDKIDKKFALAFLKRLYIGVNGGFGPLEGYGSAQDSTATGLRILAEMGELKAAADKAAKK